MKNKLIILSICLSHTLFAFCQNPLTDSLIAYYPFTGNANDSSGNGNNGTVFGATLAPDRFGNPNSAYSFNGTSDYINYIVGTKFHPATFPVTITAWIKSNSSNGIDGIFKNDNPPNIYSGVWLQINPGYGGVMVINYGDGGPNNPAYRRSKAGTTDVNDNQWHFVAGVIRDSTDMDIYIDCKYDSGAYDGTGGPVYYSNNPGNSGFITVSAIDYYYTGLMDDIRFYHRALTQTDLQLIYSYPKPYNNNLSVTLGPDTTFTCGIGAYVTLNPLVTGNVLSYQWSNNSSTASINIYQAGNYAVTVYDGCRYASDAINIKTSSATNAGILTSSRDNICMGTGLTSTLRTSGSSDSLRWFSSINGNNYSIIPGVTDSTYVTPPNLTQTTYYYVTAGTGICADTSKTVVVHILPVPLANFTFTVSGQQVTFNSSGSSQDVISFDWDFGDGSTSIFANPTHTYSHKDTFYVCLTVYNGSNCSYTLCQNIYVVNTGINNVKAKTSIQLYPNPTSNLINLYTDGLQGKYLLKIYNVLGQELKQQQLTLSQSQPIPIDLKGFQQGTYELILVNYKEYYNSQFTILK